VEYDFKNKQNNEHKHLELPYKLEKELVNEILSQMNKARDAEKDRLKRMKERGDNLKVD
jgi:DNA polymerase elongation subunit (family B)